MNTMSPPPLEWVGRSLIESGSVAWLGTDDVGDLGSDDVGRRKESVGDMRRDGSMITDSTDTTDFNLTWSSSTSRSPTSISLPPSANEETNSIGDNYRHHHRSHQHHRRGRPRATTSPAIPSPLDSTVPSTIEDSPANPSSSRTTVHHHHLHHHHSSKEDSSSLQHHVESSRSTSGSTNHSMSSNSESTGGGSGSERSSGHLNAGMDVAEYGMQKEEKVWGMPGFYDEDEGSRKFGQVLEDGIKLITPDDLAALIHTHATTDVPSSIMFPWLHGIGDGPNGAEGGPLEEFFGYPSCEPPRFRGLTVLRAPTPPVEPLTPLQSRGNHKSLLPEHPAERESPSVDMERSATERPGLFGSPVSSSRVPTPVPTSSSHVSKSYSESSMEEDALMPIPLSNLEQRTGNMQLPSFLASRTNRERSQSTSTDASTTSSSEVSTDPSMLSFSQLPPNSPFFGRSWLGRVVPGRKASNGGKAAEDNDCTASDLGSCVSSKYLDTIYSPSSSVSSFGSSDVYETGLAKQLSQAKANELDLQLVRTSTLGDDDSQSCMHPTAIKTQATFPPSRASFNAETMPISPRPIVSIVTSLPVRSSSAVPAPEGSRSSALAFDFEPPRSHSTGPLSRPAAPTPSVPTSPNPADPISGLRTASTSGRSRTGSPIPSRPGTPLRTCPPTPKKTSQTPSSSTPLQPSTPDLKAVMFEDEQPDDQPKVMCVGPTRCMLVGAAKMEDVLDIHPETALGEGDDQIVFKPIALSTEVSLRNLNIQEVKYATVSDIVLYVPDADRRDDGANRSYLRALGRSIVRAQRDLVERRRKVSRCRHEIEEIAGSTSTASPLLRYGVYIVTEPYSEIVKAYPHLDGVSKEGCPGQSLSLLHREIEECVKFSGATEVSDGVWLGNAHDNPYRDGGKQDEGPGYDLVIEAHDFAGNPTTNCLQDLKRAMSLCRQRKKNVTCNKIRDLISPGTSTGLAPILTDCISSSKSYGCSGDTTERTASGLIALAELVKSFVQDRELAKVDGGRVRPRVLVYCEDGYTETSLFALTYLMISLDLSLPQAYLHLHLNCCRSFFVYPFDLGLLMRIDYKLQDARATRRSSPPSPKTGQASYKWKPWGLGFARPSSAFKTGSSSSETSLNTTDVSSSGSLIPGIDRRWIDSMHFDGSLPSLLLPTLYLGHLGHAANAPLLHALGITNVVSVGESIASSNPSSRAQYVWRTERTVWRSSSRQDDRIEVLELSGVKDDGCDPLRPKIALACEYIDRVHRNGGKTLVHCRVGVSRSATICIAYLMKYQDMSLMDAYLMTRARRLNVLIQPNLRFLHELLGWEIQLQAERVHRRASTSQESSPQSNQSIKSTVYSWPCLCRDIHLLNKRYLA